MRCVACDAQSFEFLFTKENFAVEKCNVCNLIQVTNVPSAEEIDRYYDKHFYEHFYEGQTNSSRERNYAYRNFANKLDEIEKRIKRRGKILDVGCAFGFFLDIARKRGWETYGVEISKYAATYAQETLGLTIINKALQEAEFEENYFDVITMWSVVAHFPNPRQVFQYCSHILKDSGIVVVSTANVESHLAKIQKQNWRIWLPPFHLTYFSPVSIRNLFSVCNLEIAEINAAFPYETFLRRVGLFRILEKIKVSDKMIIYARKRRRAENLKVQ